MVKQFNKNVDSVTQTRYEFFIVMPFIMERDIIDVKEELIEFRKVHQSKIENGEDISLP